MLSDFSHEKDAGILHLLGFRALEGISDDSTPSSLGGFRIPRRGCVVYVVIGDGCRPKR